MTSHYSKNTDNMYGYTCKAWGTNEPHDVYVRMRKDHCEVFFELRTVEYDTDGIARKYVTYVSEIPSTPNVVIEYINGDTKLAYALTNDGEMVGLTLGGWMHSRYDLAKEVAEKLYNKMGEYRDIDPDFEFELFCGVNLCKGITHSVSIHNMFDC